MGLSADDRRAHPIPVRNPLRSHHSYMRTSLLPGVLEVIGRNIDHGERHIRVFAPGAVFLPRQRPNGGLPDEPMHLLVAHSRPAGAEQDAGPGTDFFAVREGYVSVTPLQVDLTNHKALQRVGEWLPGVVK